MSNVVTITVDIDLTHHVVALFDTILPPGATLQSVTLTHGRVHYGYRPLTAKGVPAIRRRYSTFMLTDAWLDTLVPEQRTRDVLREFWRRYLTKEAPVKPRVTSVRPPTGTHSSEWRAVPAGATYTVAWPSRPIDGSEP